MKHEILELIYKKKRPTKDLVVEIIDNEKVFSALKPHWEYLEELAGTMLFSTYQWTSTWWNIYGKHPHRNLHVVTVWDGIRIVAIAPFYLGISSIGSFRISSRLQLIGSGGSSNETIGFKNDSGISDFLDFIVDPEYIVDVAIFLSNYLTEYVDDHCQLTLHQIRDDSFVYNYFYPALEKQVEFTQWSVHFEETDICPCIDLHSFDSLEALIKAVNPNARQRFRQILRQFTELENNTSSTSTVVPDRSQNLLIREPENANQLNSTIQNVIALHQSRWNRIGHTGEFFDKRFIQFFQETVSYYYQKGWLWMKEAVDQEGVCAVRVLIRYNNRMYDYIIGFDDQRDSSRYRPDIALLLNAINDTVKTNTNDGEKITHVELLRGDESFKFDFTKKVIKNRKITLKSGRRSNFFRSISAVLLEWAAEIYRVGHRKTVHSDSWRRISGLM